MTLPQTTSDQTGQVNAATPPLLPNLTGQQLHHHGTSSSWPIPVGLYLSTRESMTASEWLTLVRKSSSSVCAPCNRERSGQRGESWGAQRGESCGAQRGESCGAQWGVSCGAQRGESCGAQRGESCGLQCGVSGVPCKRPRQPRGQVVNTIQCVMGGQVGGCVMGGQVGVQCAPVYASL